MKRKLYYLTENYLDSDILTGEKRITVYDIINNKPELFTEIECSYEDNSEDMIQDYLDDNGHSNEDIEVIQL